jgi:hypothetical protein
MELNRDLLRKLPLNQRIEIEENAQRKPLTQSELAAEQKRILQEIRKHKRPGTRTDLTPEKGFSEVEDRHRRGRKNIRREPQASRKTARRLRRGQSRAKQIPQAA